MVSIAQPQPSTSGSLQKGTVKQVLSGDSIVVRGVPKGGPPPERTIALSHITAPKLGRRPAEGADVESQQRDEPFAWEAREFLRKKLVGQEVTFSVDYKVPTSNREYGVVYLGKDPDQENVAESLVSEGLAEVRQNTNRPNDEYQQKLNELQNAAKAAGKGKWSETAKEHVRDIKWSLENPRNFVDSFRNKPVQAVIEHVRDGSTVRALLLPSYHYVTVMISGIKAPVIRMGEGGQIVEAEPLADEAKYFTEVRLLQRDVEIVLETVTNQNLVGSIIHPNGNIAELLLKAGYAKCVDWSITTVTGGPEKLRAAEREAKEKKVRIWKNYENTAQVIDPSSKTFQAKVVEINMGDAMVIKKANNEYQKIWLSSIRPPRQDEAMGGGGKEKEKDKETYQMRQFRPLYDIPFMFEAREFLRKKLIGKNVNVTVDYVQAANDQYSGRTCCTVTIGGQNVAEALVAKGLASVVRYKQTDENRSAQYDLLLAAEAKAEKSRRGLHSLKKDPNAPPLAPGQKTGELPIVRIQDLQGDANRSKQFMPFLQRSGRSEGVVEFVASGSRVRVYVPKETCLLTLLLAGVSCPRASRTDPKTGKTEGEPFGDEAMQFTKELCLQHEAELEVESIDKAGNFVGWLFIDGINLAQALIERGYASLHFSADRSKYFGALQVAEEKAKKDKLKIWHNYEEAPAEEDTEKSEDTQAERAPVYKNVVVTEVLPTLRFYAQHVEEGPKLEHMMSELRAELEVNPPLVGAYNPRKGEMCAAKFSDGLWYRARIESSKGKDHVEILYVDFGNRETTSSVRLAQLPPAFHSFQPGAREFALAFVKLPNDPDYADSARAAFQQEISSYGASLKLSDEYRVAGLPHVTLLGGLDQTDLGKSLVADGVLLAETRREKRLQKIVSEYLKVQDEAKRTRRNMWRYGDFTGDEL